MNLALTMNFVTILLCIGVIVQASRMMRQLRAVASSEMGAVVTGLDRATHHAGAVLADLRQTLASEGSGLAQTLADAQELREELTMLIGIANSMAERLVDASHGPSGPVIDAASPALAAIEAEPVDAQEPQEFSEDDILAALSAHLAREAA